MNTNNQIKLYLNEKGFRKTSNMICLILIAQLYNLNSYIVCKLNY